MGNNIASFTRSVATTPTKASTCMFSVRGILLITYSFSWFKMSRTLVKYWDIRSSLASYFPWICPTTSWESLQISSLDAESASVRFNPDMMASYSVSLLDAENSSRMACSNCSLVDDHKKRPTPDPEDRQAPLTYRVYHPSLPGFLCQEGCWGTSAMKSTMTCHLIDNLDWYSISYSLNSMAHFSILPNRSGLCKMLMKGWLVSTTIGSAWKKGRSF